MRSSLSPLLDCGSELSKNNWQNRSARNRTPSKLALPVQKAQQLVSLVKDSLAYASARDFAAEACIAENMRAQAQQGCRLRLGKGYPVAESGLVCLQLRKSSRDDLLNERAEVRLVEREFHGNGRVKKRTAGGFACDPFVALLSRTVQWKSGSRFLGMKRLTCPKEGVN
jgi:hypothetical protein